METETVFKIIEYAGAFWVMTAFLLLQFKIIPREHRLFNLLNFLGGFALEVVAIYWLHWGWIVLEAIFSVVSLYWLIRGGAASRVVEFVKVVGGLETKVEATCVECHETFEGTQKYQKMAAPEYCLGCARSMYGLSRENTKTETAA